MSEDRYRELQNAITKARRERYAAANPVWVDERNAHLDTLQAILDRHTPKHGDVSKGCSGHGLILANGGGYKHTPWPCPDVRVVETALSKMGALND